MGLSVHCRCFLFPGPCDYWYFSSSDPCLYVGGCYSHCSYFVLFFVDFDTASYCYGGVGCRFLFDFIQPHILRHRQPHTPW